MADIDYNDIIDKDTTEPNKFNPNNVSHVTARINSVEKKARMQMIQNQKIVGEHVKTISLFRMSLQRMNNVASEVASASKQMVISTARFTKDSMVALKQSITTEFNANKPNLFGMSIARSFGPIVGFVAAKFAESGFVQNTIDSLKEKTRNAISGALSSIREKLDERKLRKEERIANIDRLIEQGMSRKQAERRAPRLAKGGLVQRDTFAKLHKGEAIVPVNKLMEPLDKIANSFSGPGQKGLFKSLFSAVTGNYKGNVFQRMLANLQDIRVGVVGEASRMRLIFNRLFLENPFFRNSVRAIKTLQLTLSAPKKILGILTKPRGGYYKDLPKRGSPPEQSAAILGILYTNSMIKYDQMLFYLKAIATSSFAGIGPAPEDAGKEDTFLKRIRKAKKSKGLKSKFLALSGGREGGFRKDLNRLGLILSSFVPESVLESYKSKDTTVIKESKKYKKMAVESIDYQRRTAISTEEIKKKAKGFGSLIWKGMIFLVGAIKNFFMNFKWKILKEVLLLPFAKIRALFGMLKFLRTLPFIGKMLGFVGKLAIRGIAGLGLMGGGAIMAGADAIEGWKKSKEWFGSKAGIREKASSAIGAALGGTSKSWTAEGASKGAVKGGLMGAGIGTMVAGPVGTVIGGAIGALAGGILGFVGGENISKAVDWVLKKVGKLIKGIFSFITWPIRTLWKAVTWIWDWLKEKWKNYEWKGVSQFVYDVVSWPFNKIVEMATSFKDSIVGFFEKHDILKWAINTVWKVFTFIPRAMVSIVTGIGKWILEKITNIPVVGDLLKKSSIYQSVVKVVDDANKTGVIPTELLPSATISKDEIVTAGTNQQVTLARAQAGQQAELAYAQQKAIDRNNKDTVNALHANTGAVNNNTNVVSNTSQVSNGGGSGSGLRDQNLGPLIMGVVK